ncbi:MAG TPA: hypothetical protein VFR28_09400 [Allosphingosinicella sp.]|nr:hypothetical protein [Allosphingosinicella sp.]
MGGFGLFIFLSALADPTIVLAAAGVGLLARRWWHLLPGGLAPPFAHWAFYSTFYGPPDVGPLLPFLLLAGAMWSSAIFAIKRAWTR